MFGFKNYSIRLKLLIIFIVFKILPLLLLAGIGIYSFFNIEDLMYKNTKYIVQNSQDAINKTANYTITDSIKALDKKSQDILEKQTVLIAQKVADFLHERDNDILFLSKSVINQKNIKRFYNGKTGYMHVPVKYIYDNKKNSWVLGENINNVKNDEIAMLSDNSKDFHKARLADQHMI